MDTQNFISLPQKVSTCNAIFNCSTPALLNTFLDLNSGRADTVKILIELGAKVDAKIDDGWTPLLIAAQNGN